MALEQLEQRLRAELRRKKSTLQNAISDANVNKRLAESPSESADRRANARTKFNSLQDEIKKLRSEVKDLEDDVQKEQSRKEIDDVKINYTRLKEQYDLLLDKNTPEAKALATKVNSEVVKLNKAYSGAGLTTRVEQVAPIPVSKTQISAERGRTATRAKGIQAREPITAGAETAPITDTTAIAGTAGAATAGTAAGAGATGGKGGKGGKDEETPKLSAEERYANAIAKAQELYNMPDIIFKNVDSLGRLLKRYVNNELTDAQFVREIQNDAWYRTNSDEIKARYVQLFNYEDLVNTGRAQGTTNYEQEIDRITRSVQAEARRMRGVEVDDADARAIAKDLYIFNLDKDASIIRERIARFIKPVAGMIGGQLTEDYGGEALKNYQALQSLAKSNGFKLEDILPKDALGKPLNAQSTLQALATGKLDITRVAQDVRKLAAVGQSDFVKELLGQGFNLSDVYAPYKRRMATILELPEDQIDLRDPALQMAIGKQGDMNIFDYEKMLRNDNRWSYTKQAREEVTNAASAILRNFGFVG